MALEEVARILLDNGVELLICGCEGVEGVGLEGWVEDRLRVGEDCEEEFWREGVETRHVLLLVTLAMAVVVLV